MFLLLIGLLILTFLIYVLNHKDLLSPTFITSFMYLVGTVFAFVGMQKWTKVSFHYGTILVIVSAIVMMEIGELIVRQSSKKTNTRTSAETNVVGALYEIPLWVRVLGLTISFVACYLYYNRLVEIAYEYGYTGSNLLAFIRNGLLDGKERTGYVIVLLRNFTQSFCFVSIFCFSNNVIYSNSKKRIKKYIFYLLPIIPVSFLYYISSSRYAFLKLIIFALFCFLMIYFKKRKGSISFKAMTRIAVCILLFALIFYLIYGIMGADRGSFAVDSVGDKFVMYAGSSIVGLSEYVGDGMIRSDYFGEETLTGLFSLVGRFVPDFVSGTKFLEFISLTNTMKTNIYTMIRSLIADYGMIGMLITELLIGFVFALFYQKVMSRSLSSLSLILYSYFAFGLIYQLFTPFLFTDLFSVTQILEVFWIVLIFWFIKICKKPILIKEGTCSCQTVPSERKD